MFNKNSSEEKLEVKEKVVKPWVFDAKNPSKVSSGNGFKPKYPRSNFKNTKEVKYNNTKNKLNKNFEKPSEDRKDGTEQHIENMKPVFKSFNNLKRHVRTPIRIIPLGGLNEIGKNITCFECGNDMFIVDCGLAFPDSDMPGVDIVIPDFSYIEKNVDKLRGVVLTHGHEDHIGSLPYFLKKFNVPVYGNKLTLGLVENKLKEHGLLNKVKLNVTVPKQVVHLGCMGVEFIRVNHSIPDACGLAIHSPAGVLIHTGDFKIDYSPIESEMIDLARFGELGNRGVLALMSDSTNAGRRGSSMSERSVGEGFNHLFEVAKGKRILVATFASNVHRVQQIVNSACLTNRKVAVSGRSMINTVKTATELGYLKIPQGILIDIDAISRYPKEQVVVITTGSQGEPMSALSRMASGDHRNIKIMKDDYVIISATPIPGNEKHVNKIVNELMKLGAEVISDSLYNIHVSGHAYEDEQKLILSLTKPDFFIPFHGEYKHLKNHAKTAIKMGMCEDHIHIGQIGQVIELNGVDMKVVGNVTAGQVLVDGLGVGDVGSIVLRDRKHLAQDGLIIVVATIEKESGTIVSGPDIVSRGFVYVRESEALMSDAKNIVNNAFMRCLDNDIREWGALKISVRDELSNFIYRKTRRSPMILPVIMEI